MVKSGGRAAKGMLPLITELEIRLRVSQIAEAIARDADDRGLVVVAVLKGAFMFLADLLRRLADLGLEPRVDFIRAASYGSGTRSKGQIKISLDCASPVKGRTVLLVDDIVDSGRTLSRLQRHLKAKGAARVQTCVLLDKPSRREVEFQPDYVGFEIPDHFVVGYGMDFDERYRYLPFIGILEETRGERRRRVILNGALSLVRQPPLERPKSAPRA